MSNRKRMKDSNSKGSNLFELEPIMKFQEIPLDKAMKMLNDSDIIVSEQEASDILLFLHTLVKITIKEFLSPKD